MPNRTREQGCHHRRLPRGVVLGEGSGGLERLGRYILRPPFAQERLRLRKDGRVALELKTAWRDGTRALDALFPTRSTHA